jgi:heme O synthase-like polyprenyltransferase
VVASVVAIYATGTRRGQPQAIDIGERVGHLLQLVGWPAVDRPR